MIILTVRLAYAGGVHPPEPKGVGLANSAGRGRLKIEERGWKLHRPVHGPLFTSPAALARGGLAI
jgi:hypothetical protein